MTRKLLMLGVGCFLIAGTASAGDDWDYSSSNDNAASTTVNRLLHGVRQSHDLQDMAGPTADQDWYGISSEPYASYEAIADGFSGAVAIPTRYASDGTTELGYAASVDSAGGAYSLRWMNTTSSAVSGFVLMGAGSTGNDTYERYDIRMYETTIRLARFNCVGTQNTVIICQNPTRFSIAGNEYFWNAAGTLVATNPITVGAHATSVVSGGTISGVAGASGSVTVAHNGPYGSLNCKTVALEAATGFSFDTPGVYRP